MYKAGVVAVKSRKIGSTGVIKKQRCQVILQSYIGASLGVSSRIDRWQLKSRKYLFKKLEKLFSFSSNVFWHLILPHTSTLLHFNPKKIDQGFFISKLSSYSAKPVQQFSTEGGFTLSVLCSVLRT
jgi:hypothetical protein